MAFFSAVGRMWHNSHSLHGNNNKLMAQIQYLKFQRDHFQPQHILKLCATTLRILVYTLTRNKQSATWQIIKLSDLLRTARLLRSSVKLATIAFEQAILPKHQFWSLQVKATAMQYCGCYLDSNHCFEQALSIANTLEQSFAYQHYGKSLVEQGNYSEASQLFAKALQIREEARQTSLIDSTKRAMKGLEAITT
jgi:tetratricopeptide (TPR) repeat protein